MATFKVETAGADDPQRTYSSVIRLPQRLEPKFLLEICCMA